MAITTRIEPIAKDIELMLADIKGAGAGQALAQFAREEIEAAKETNRSVLGRVPPFKIVVDGNKGASLDSVKGDGVIFVEFELIGDLLTFISDMLHQFSPTKTGTYKRSHIILADGQQVEATAGQVPIAQEYVFINSVPYARKIERGSSSQAPNGVYEAVSLLARRRFGNIASVVYAFRSITTGRGRSDRNPAVVVRLRG